MRRKKRPKPATEYVPRWQWQTDPEWRAELAAMRARRETEEAQGLPDAKAIPKREYTDEERREWMLRGLAAARAATLARPRRPDHLRHVSLSLFLLPHQAAWLQETAAQLGVTRSALVREALEAMMERAEGD